MPEDTQYKVALNLEQWAAVDLLISIALKNDRMGEKDIQKGRDIQHKINITLNEATNY